MNSKLWWFVKKYINHITKDDIANFLLLLFYNIMDEWVSWINKNIDLIIRWCTYTPFTDFWPMLSKEWLKRKWLILFPQCLHDHCLSFSEWINENDIVLMLIGGLCWCKWFSERFNEKKYSWIIIALEYQSLVQCLWKISYIKNITNTT